MNLKLFTGLSNSTFIKNIWDKKMLLNRISNPLADKILTLQKLEEILQNSNFTTRNIRLSSTEKNIPTHFYTNPDQTINTQRLLHLFNHGATIIIKNFETYNSDVRLLCTTLANEIGGIKRMFVNLYLTPPSSQGFFAHYDTQNVFIFQIDGEKAWNLYDTPFESPLESHEFELEKYKPNLSKLKKKILQKGDVLFIPRGMMHEARSTGTLSLHLTFSFVPFTWNDLIQQYFNVQSNLDPTLRKSLPQIKNIDRTLRKEFQNKLTLHSESLSIAMAKLLDQMIKKDFFVSVGFLKKIAESNGLTPNSYVLLNDVYETEVQEIDNVLIITFGDTKMQLPIEARGMINFLLKKKSCQIKKIPFKYNEENKLLIIEKLVKNSILLVSDPS